MSPTFMSGRLENKFMYMNDEEIILNAKWLINRSVERVFTRYVIDTKAEKLEKRVDTINESVLQYIDVLYKDNTVAWANLNSEAIEKVLFCMLLRGEI